ncbi:tetratricopeptide repeat protein [Sphingomonas sp. LB-2]|uniref:tetratricopeptide repeat protein n=1 Tax=Sphingomonas caeni TaxID=2984949 RepID=UPI0022329E17|nr:tetratricopeptide repeat protein [Sphingomonas caeni]MCW3847469.1 tetratricopeptide repeat protein [Sphingomonas caeni]
MIADAIISGSIEQALYRDADGLWVVGVPDERPRPAAPRDVMTFRGIAREVCNASADGLPISFETLLERLRHEVAFARALRGVLIGMDPDFSERLRRSGIDSADAILAAHPGLEAAVGLRLHVPTNGQEWDPGQGLEFAAAMGAARVASVYSPLADEAVSRVFDALEQVIEDQLGKGVEAHHARAGLIQSGLVSRVCTLVSRADGAALRDLTFHRSDFPGLAGIDPNGKVTLALVRHLSVASIEVQRTAAGADEQEAGHSRAMSLADAVIQARDGWARRRQKGTTQHQFDITAIQREIDWIANCIQRDQLARAEYALLQLILEQADRSKPSDLAKTLTSIADQARRARYFDFCLELLDLVDLLEARDAAAANVRGEVLKAMGRYDEALATFFATMERFPANEVAPTAYAETLRELGRHDEALATYRAAMKRFPNNVVTPNAYAGALRELGRYDEALKTFRATMKRFPDDVVSHTAYAETLRELRRHDEALEMFRATAERFPTDEVAPTAHAEALRELGRYDEALTMFRGIMKRFPNNMVAPNAYAETLRDLGRHDEALARFRATMEKFPTDVVAPTAYAQTLRELGRHDEALAAFRATLDRFPNNEVAPTAYAETLRELGRHDEALATFRATMERHPGNSRIRTAYANFLVSLGRPAEGEALLKETARHPHTRNEWVAAHVLAMSLLRRGDFESALAILKDGREAPFADVAPYFRSSYALALVTQHRAGEALREFETLRKDRLPVDVSIPMLEAHAFGELGDYQAATDLLGKIDKCRLSTDQKALSDLLVRKYVLRNVNSIELEAVNDNILKMEVSVSLAATREILLWKRAA